MQRAMGLQRRLKNKQLGLGLLGGLMVAFAAIAPAQAQTEEQNNDQALRLAEAIREVSLAEQTKETGLYSDWKVKGDAIPLWSQQCIGRPLTPNEFAGNRATAGAIVVCVLRDMLRQENRMAGGDEALAVRRTSAWWFSGNGENYNRPGVAGITQQVLAAYGPVKPTPTRPQSQVSQMPPVPTPSNAGVIVPTEDSAPKLQPFPGKVSTLPPAPKLQPLPTPGKPVITKPVTEKPTTAVEKPPVLVKPVEKPGEKLPEVAKPVMKPAEKPVEKPAEKPVAKPIEQPGQKPAEKPTEKPTEQIETIKVKMTSQAYDRYMQAGYAATREKSYVKAVLFFRRALDESPGDSYASKAIANIEPSAAKEAAATPK